MQDIQYSTIRRESREAESRSSLVICYLEFQQLMWLAMLYSPIPFPHACNNLNVFPCSLYSTPSSVLAALTPCGTLTCS